MIRASHQASRFTALILAGCVSVAASCHADQDFSESARLADFKFFTDQFKDNYAYVDRKEKPWETWDDRFAAAVSAADSPESYAAVIESALDELHDFHAEVRSRNPHRWLPVPTFADMWAEFQGTNAVIIAVRRGGDAERAAITPGDRVTMVGAIPLEQALAERLTTTVDNHDPSARAWALLSLLTGRADESRVLTIMDKSGRSHRVTLPLERRFDRSPGALSSKVLSENIGLIRFNNSLGDQTTVAAFDSALGLLRSTRGLILDLRDVPSGGDSSVALGIMGRLIETMLPYQRHRIPHYGQSDVERNWIELVAPRGPFTYTAPVVVLVNHWTGSMGEGMAIGLDAMHRAKVVGTPMAHLAGAVSDLKLPQTGIDLAFATEQLYHVNGTPRQVWLPPVLLKDDSTAVDDANLARGLTELRALISSSSER
ncbi:MAG: S41 family peptidase [Verrucomicrobiota bacterium]